MTVTKNVPKREVVKSFFSFEVGNKPEPRGRARSIIIAIAASAIIFVVGADKFSGQQVSDFTLYILLALNASLLPTIYYLCRRWENHLFKQDLKHYDGRLGKLQDLAEATRRLQIQDLNRAFIRIFDRTLIDRADLRILDQKYVLPEESALFEEESNEESLDKKRADLINKSVRLISRVQGDRINFRTLLTRKGTLETYFNPQRMIILFLTQSQIVICDVTIDSSTGDLQEDILRVSLSQVVSLSSASLSERFELSESQMLSITRDTGMGDTLADISRWERSNGKWSVKEERTILKITRTDGQALTFPIRSRITFGETTKALDRDDSLSKDELSVDLMINDINRLIEGAR